MRLLVRPTWHRKSLLRTGGNVTVELDGDVRITVNSTSPGYNPACACGRVVVAIPTPALGIVVRVFRLLDPERPLRALHLVPIGLEATFNSTDLFHPRFVGMLRAIGASAEGAGRGPLLLRFSGWAQELATITFEPYARTATWEDRALPGAWGIAQAGVPLEHMCALARAAGAGAAWFSVPQNAAGAAAVAGGCSSGGVFVALCTHTRTHACAAGATYLRNFTRLLVDELLAGAAADALSLGPGAVLPPAWRAVAPGMSMPVPLADPAAAPWAAGSGSPPRNLSRVVIQVCGRPLPSASPLLPMQAQNALVLSAPLRPRPFAVLQRAELLHRRCRRSRAARHGRGHDGRALGGRWGGGGRCRRSRCCCGSVCGAQVTHP